MSYRFQIDSVKLTKFKITPTFDVLYIYAF